ncbi:hypothetical protein CCR87_12185 [Rhodobaculum claviforme]|uniref:VPLPA-CTERM protein sorting domain-containing protein n=1 Tax=Rhodobaculum claviforme TaxID=1549854 RepID=A0A934TMA0_9RHOB|nr:hypothetical protein [Rhodobaculum claviforme]
MSDFDDFNAGRQNVVVAPGQTVDLNGRSFNFSQGGSFTDPSDLLAFINSPTPRLEGFLETFLSARLPAGDDVSNNSTTQMSLSLEYVFRQDPVNVIPLPAAGWMLLSGIAGLGGLGYFRRRTNA